MKMQLIDVTQLHLLHFHMLTSDILASLSSPQTFILSDGEKPFLAWAIVLILTVNEQPQSLMSLCNLC